ncbi:hypothetical protein XdyCFBP7245_23180 [Xanthomonas dyei]|uniref:Uncharacterized protein n=1 Tax=Xanthomonas dyei TaxID=743699 RepID=A0A2S7BEW1_9XANT|nr:hypothetical protein XdyCFBP7245_23180 [Xanthomonas dyei]
MTPLTFSAPSYALLQATTQCWKCAKAIPVTTVWVTSFVDNEGVEEPDDEPEVVSTPHKIDPSITTGLRAY